MAASAVESNSLVRDGFNAALDWLGAPSPKEVARETRPGQDIASDALVATVGVLPRAVDVHATLSIDHGKKWTFGIGSDIVQGTEALERVFNEKVLEVTNLWFVGQPSITYEKTNGQLMNVEEKYSCAQTIWQCKKVVWNRQK